VIFIIKRELEADFRHLIGERIARVMEVDYAYQELEDLPGGYAVPQERTKPWGTVHAILAARDLIHGPFAVINADDYYGPAAYSLIFNYLSSHRKPGHHAMVGYRVGNTVTKYGGVTRGVCAYTEAEGLTEIVERTGIEKNGRDACYSVDGGKSWVHLPGDTVVSMNFWGFQRDFLEEAAVRFPAYLDQIMQTNPRKGECYLPLLVGDLVREKAARVDVLFSPNRWFGVTYREDKPAVQQALRALTAEGLYPEELWGLR